MVFGGSSEPHAHPSEPRGRVLCMPLFRGSLKRDFQQWFHPLSAGSHDLPTRQSGAFPLGPPGGIPEPFRGPVTVSELGERELIARITHAASRSRHGSHVGPGDDAAVVEPVRGELRRVHDRRPRGRRALRLRLDGRHGHRPPCARGEPQRPGGDGRTAASGAAVLVVAPWRCRLRRSRPSSRGSRAWPTPRRWRSSAATSRARRALCRSTSRPSAACGGGAR